MKLKTVTGLVGKYLLAVVAIAICGTVLIYHSPSPFRVQRGGYTYIIPKDGDKKQLVWREWSEPDPDSIWYKFTLWAMSPPVSLLVALPITLLLSKEVFK